MNIKQCYILDNARGFVFYGPLDQDLSGTSSYDFYEVPELIKDRPIKLVGGLVVVDLQKEYNDKIEYQKLAFKEYRDEILKQILYANVMGATQLSSELKDALILELSAYESRVNLITMEVE